MESETNTYHTLGYSSNDTPSVVTQTNLGNMNSEAMFFIRSTRYRQLTFRCLQQHAAEKLYDAKQRPTTWIRFHCAFYALLQ